LSAISYIYSQIKTQLETVVGIGYVGKWNNQLENDSRERQFTYPCVLIEFGSVEWLNTDQKPSLGNTGYQQKGNVEVTIHTLFKSLDNSTDTFSDHVDFCKLIWDSLTNFKATLVNVNSEPIGGFTPLQRVRDIDDSNHDTVRDWQTVYSSMIFEAANSQSLVDAAPVSLTIIGQLPSQSTPPVVIPICADADVYLNGSPQWTVASGDVLELSIVNQSDVEVTPISVVDGVIKINDSVGVLDATVTLDGDAFLTIAPGANEDINLLYDNGNQAIPTSVVGSVITLPNPAPNYDPRDLVDHTTLNWINPFGNNNRFTDDVGTQIYTNGISIDWTLYNIPAATVVCFNLTLYSGNFVNAGTYASTLTLGGLSVWKIGIWEELALLPDEVNWYDFAPFNWVIGAGGSNSRLRINSFNNGTSTISARVFREFGAETNTNTRLNPITRVTTLAELGL